MPEPNDSVALRHSAPLPAQLADQVPEFPAMRQKAPPVPPPVEHQPPPVPPPVDRSLQVDDSDFSVQRLARPSSGLRKRRDFPRRRLALAAAILVLVCFGLCSDDGTESQSSNLATTPVAFSEPALPAAASIDSPEVQEPTGCVGEVVETDSGPTQQLANSNAIEPNPVSSNYASTPSKSIQVARGATSLSSRPQLDIREPAEPSDQSNELTDTWEAESEVCQLTIPPERLLGTAIQWAETANEAAMIADDRDKLVYLIQVSGNFAIPEYT